MAGNSSTILFAGTGGDSIYNEDIGGSPVIHMPATKIHTGALGVDGGPATATNPLFVELSDGSAAVGTSGNPLFAKLAGQAQQATANSTTVVEPSDHTMRVIDSAPNGVGWSDFTTLSTAASTSTVVVASGTGRLVGALRVFNPNAGAINVAFFNGAGTWGTASNLIDYFPVGINTTVRVDYVRGGIGIANGMTVIVSTSNWPTAAVAPAASVVINGRST